MDQFYSLFSILLMVSAFMAISSYNPIHSVFWLVMVFLQSAVLLMSLSYEFLGLMLVMIYVGAMAILFLFVIMMLDIFQLSKMMNFSNILPMLFLLLFQLTIENNFNNKMFMNYMEDWFFMKNSYVISMGTMVYNDLGIMFMMMSILLLMAMIGAMVLTLEINEISKSQTLMNQHQSNNSWM